MTMTFAVGCVLAAGTAVAGYRVLPVPYAGFPEKVRGDAEKLRACFDIAWTRILALLSMSLCSTFLSKISKEMEFCLMVFWLAVWVFF